MSMGEVRGKTFVKLMEAVVESASMYGAEVTTTWAEELEERPKLGVLKELVSGGFGARSVGVRRKKMRRILTKLRGGTAELQVEVGRWRSLKREERKCTECDS